MTDSDVLAEIAAQLHDVQVGAALDPRRSYEECDYASPGTYPFCCKSCQFFEAASDLAGVCRIVDGPYQGLVGAEDTCRLFQPCRALVTHEEEVELEDDGGEEMEMVEQPEMTDGTEDDGEYGEPTDSGDHLGAA